MLINILKMPSKLNYTFDLYSILSRPIQISMKSNFPGKFLDFVEINLIKVHCVCANQII